jgi:hypothetical protein
MVFNVTFKTISVISWRYKIGLFASLLSTQHYLERPTIGWLGIKIPKLYSLWFIPTGARTHDLPHSRRARKPLHLDAVKLRYNPNHKLCMVIHYKRWIRSKFFQYIRVQRFVINIYIVHSLNSRSLYTVNQWMTMLHTYILYLNNK